MVVAAWGPCDVVISQLPSAPRNLRPSGTDPGRPRTPPETTQTGRYETRGSSVVNWNEQQTGTKMPDFPAPVLVLDATAAKAEQTRQEASAQPTTTVVASPTPAAAQEEGAGVASWLQWAVAGAAVLGAGAVVAIRRKTAPNRA